MSQNIYAQSGTLYEPSRFLDVSRGMSISQFEDPKDAAKAVVVEQGFIRQPQRVSTAIVVFNYSGRAIGVSCDIAKRLSRTYPVSRENEQEIDAIALPNGHSCHFVIPPHTHIVSVKEQTRTENGKLKWLSRDGFTLSELRDKVITYERDCSGYTVSETLVGGIIDGYTYVQNNTPNLLSVKVTRQSCAYDQTEDEIMQSKLDRLPDNGGEVVAEATLAPRSIWHFKTADLKYDINAFELEKLSKDQTGSYSGYGIPSSLNYVFLCDAGAYAGQFVGFFSSNARNGSLCAKTYNPSECKMVSGDIAINSTSLKR